MWCRSVIALGALFVAVSAAGPAGAATVRGTFRYLDTASPACPNPAATGCTPLQPIAFAKVEIWHIGVFFWNTWAKVGEITTDSQGFFSFSDGRGDGTYGVRVFATSYAAVVFPNDDVYTPFTLPFHREPGEPGPIIRRTVSSASDVRDFSFTFTDGWAPQHYNIAEAVRRAFDYASARRGDTDPIPPARVYGIGFLDLSQVSHYNPTDDAIRIHDTQTFEDLLIVHEYAHYLEAHIGTLAWLPAVHDGCQARDWLLGNLMNSREHAWMEGFADYLAQAVNRTLPAGTLQGTPGNGTHSVARLETPPACGAAAADAVEDFVAATIWDLLDPANEPHDFVGGNDVAIFQIFDLELDQSLGRWPTIWDFRNAWIARRLDRPGLDRIMSQHAMLSLPNQTAQVLAQSVPTQMSPGQSYAVSVTVRNTGITTWTFANTYRLGSQNPQDNGTWAVSRVPLPVASVAPGGQVTFSFSVTAPATAGSYNFQWRMVQEWVEWFGDFTPNIVVAVGTPPPDPQPTTDPQPVRCFDVELRRWVWCW